MREQALRREEGDVSFTSPPSDRVNPLRIGPVEEARTTAASAPGLARAASASDQLAPWEKFYGLYRRPFSLTPDLRFAFNSRSHAHAFQQVSQALKRREGLIVVTGDIGTGKTMLCRSLLETFEARTFLCVVLDPRLTVDDLLRQVLTDFGLLTRPDPGVGAQSPPSRHQLVSTLQQFLASLVPLNAHAVVMIDEAQQLDPALLEQIRLLSNFETDEAKLLQIVLVGQPDLDALLQRPDMRQLNQRVARRAELYPLSPDEVGDYIRRRLAVAAEPPPGVTPISPDGMAGGRVPIEITAEAAAAIATLSAGIPRVVNTLSDRTLEVGYERQTRVLDETIVATAAERLKLAAPAPIAATETALETNAPAVTAYEPPQAVEAAIRGGLPIGKFAAAACVAAAVGGIAWLGWTRASTGRPAVGFARPAATAPGPAPAAREPAATAPPAATTPPSAAPPSPAVPAVTYHITVAAFRTAQRASSVAASLKERGLPMYTRLDPTSEWRLVIAGPFKSTADAAAAQQTLAAEGFSDTRVVADE